MSHGRVYLIGAGPGDPGLLTIKGRECLARADVIVYDRLAHPSLLAHARPDCELIYVGKASNAHTMKQSEINRLLIDRAMDGKTVARLKGGDPFVFGRGGEEAEALADSGIDFEVVPGVTSAIAVPAYAGIPVTHRGLCSTLCVITGHESPEKAESGIDWERISTGADTLVFLMGVENLPNIVARLMENGRAPSTPVALIRWGARPEQETLVGSLSDIARKAQESGFASPAVTVVGDVVNLRERLRWFDNRPLFGARVLVSRARTQAGALSRLLMERGASPIEFPVIRIAPPESFSELDAAIARMEEYDWLILTSANGVSALTDRLHDLRLDVRALKGPRIAAMGARTAEALEGIGLRVDYTPSEFVAEAFVNQFPQDPSGLRALILRAEEARDTIPRGLTDAGAVVDVVSAYRTEMNEADAPRLSEIIGEGIDVVTLTSSSTAKALASLAGPLPESTLVVSIGPITSRTAHDLGLRVDAEAREYTIEGMVDALERLYRERRGETGETD